MLGIQRLLRLGVLAISGIMLGGCPSDVRVDIQPGSTLDHLTFTISRGASGKGTELSGFLVEACASAFTGPSKKFWLLEPVNNPPRIDHLSYGTSPEGYRATIAPQRLERGSCYTVAYGGTSELYFVIDGAGAIRKIDKEEARRLT
jgi:hypothetical protein